MRSSASTSASIVAVLPSGTTGTVLAGPTVANGYTWWRISTSSGTGWVVATWLAKTGSGGGTWAPGTSIRVSTPDGSKVNLRASASTSAPIIAVMANGTTGTVVSGPTSANGYSWYQINTTYGTGWAVTTWLVKV